MTEHSFGERLLCLDGTENFITIPYEVEMHQAGKVTQELVDRNAVYKDQIYRDGSGLFYPVYLSDETFENLTEMEREGLRVKLEKLGYSNLYLEMSGILNEW